MHLGPTVTQEDAYEYLKAQVELAWGEEHVPAMEEDLKLVAEAMARIGVLTFPRDLEPLLL